MLGSLFHSFILAQALGLFLLIMAIIMLSRAQYYKNLIQNLVLDNGVIFVGASFLLLLGLFFVIVHNIWVAEPRVIVTIISWLILIEAVLWLAIPEYMLELCKKIYAGPGYYIIAVIMTIIGLLVLTKGFYLFL